jgi:ubiquinone/menaquinone biosynthesis C-methylase UbiE
MRNKNPRNIWRFWRPIYGFTWATWQASSYAHYASYLNTLQNSIVLDIGTGTGEYIKSLKKNDSCQFIFTDPDEKSLLIAQKNALELGLNCTFIVGGINEILESKLEYTHISLVHVLSVLDDPECSIIKIKNIQTSQVKIIAYLSRFNASSERNKKSKLGFSRLNRKWLESEFISCRVGLFNRMYESSSS